MTGSGPKVLLAEKEIYEPLAAGRLLFAILESLKDRPRCSVALAGGSTPMPVYRALASEPLKSRVPWDRIDWWFGDERCVKPDDPASNYGAARAALFAPAGVPDARVHRMMGEWDDRDRAARDYESRLPQALDVLILGIGEDGHTASLFPGAAALSERTRRVLPIQGSKPPPWRLTLTPPAIESARAIIVLATGTGKAKMIGKSLAAEGSESEVPARLARRGLWIVDRAAAADIPPDVEKDSAKGTRS